MKSYFKISLLLLIVLIISTVSISATPMHYDDDRTSTATPIFEAPATANVKKAKQKKGKWLSRLFKKKPRTAKQKAAKKLKRAKKKLLWTLFKNQFKSKKKTNGTGTHIEFWSLAAFIIGFLAFLTFIVSFTLTDLFTSAGTLTALIFYLLLGTTSYLFAEWGQRNIELYPEYYTGRSLTKWAKAMVLAPVIFIAIAFLVYLLDF